MGVGRPKEFDEREALERAMDLFWLSGYGSVGLAALLRHMRISRQSLYDTFGNKRGLFLRVIAHYRETRLTHALALLERDEPPLENVRAVLEFFEKLASDPRHRGCLVANALVEMAPHDAEIAALLAETLELLRSGLERALQQARESGELHSGRSTRELSRALVGSLIGLSVLGRLPLEPSPLDEVAAGSLALLD